jgi:hypothetical protein
LVPQNLRVPTHRELFPNHSNSLGGRFLSGLPSPLQSRNDGDDPANGRLPGSGPCPMDGCLGNRRAHSWSRLSFRAPDNPDERFKPEEIGGSLR